MAASGQPALHPSELTFYFFTFAVFNALLRRMTDKIIRDLITEKYTVVGMPPKLRHHCTGPEAETYSYLPWDAVHNEYSVVWRWLGPRASMLLSLGLEPHRYEPPNAFRMEMPGMDNRYFLTLAAAMRYWEKMGKPGAAMIRDRWNNKIVHPDIV